MKTTKPISTISFNSAAYLKLKLNELIRAKKLSFWCFVEHKPEDDEAGKKIHFHVYAEPSKLLQTDDLRAFLAEFDPNHPDKPLGCLMWRSSKFADYYLYGLHDPAYLAQKGQSRRFHYKHEDFVCSDDGDFLQMVRTIDRTSVTPFYALLDAQKSGLSFAEYFSRGTIPLPQVALYQRAWDLLLQSVTYRANKQAHEMDVDPLTGELPPTEQDNHSDLSADFKLSSGGSFVEYHSDEDLPY